MKDQVQTINLRHPLCTTDEFGVLLRKVTAVINRYIRQGKIKSTGRMIHIREAARFGMSIDDCLAILVQLRSPKLELVQAPAGDAKAS